MKALAAAALMLAWAAQAGAPARSSADRTLARVTAGRVAGAPLRCIRPELRTPSEIVDRQAIIYRFANTAYVGRLRGGCPLLRQGRTTVIMPLNGEICVNDPVRIVDSGTPIDLCTFESFTPYTRAR